MAQTRGQLGEEREKRTKKRAKKRGKSDRKGRKRGIVYLDNWHLSKEKGKTENKRKRDKKRVIEDKKKKKKTTTTTYLDNLLGQDPSHDGTDWRQF